MSNAINKLIPPKLEPCPHCGAEPIMKPREHNVSYIVICWRCGLNGPTDELGVQSCADSWNRLSRAARLLAAVEGLAADSVELVYPHHVIEVDCHYGLVNRWLIYTEQLATSERTRSEVSYETLADALIALGEATNG